MRWERDLMLISTPLFKEFRMHSLFLPILRGIKKILLLLAVTTILSSKGERKQKKWSTKSLHPGAGNHLRTPSHNNLTNSQMRPYDILHERKPPAVTHKVPTSPHSDIFIARLAGHGKHNKYFGNFSPIKDVKKCQSQFYFPFNRGGTINSWLWGNLIIINPPSRRELKVLAPLRISVMVWPAERENLATSTRNTGQVKCTGQK